MSRNSWPGYRQAHQFKNIIHNSELLKNLTKNLIHDTPSVITCKYIAKQIMDKFKKLKACVTDTDGITTYITITFQNGRKFIVSISFDTAIRDICFQKESSAYLNIFISPGIYLEKVITAIETRIHKRLLGFKSESDANSFLDKLKKPDYGFKYYILSISRSTKEEDISRGKDFTITVSEKMLGKKVVEARVAKMISKTISLNIKSNRDDFEKHSKKFPDVFPILATDENQFRLDLEQIIDQVYKTDKEKFFNKAPA